MQGADPERADSKVLSDEEVEEAEASDSFPALGYPAGLGSIGSGRMSGRHHWMEMSVMQQDVSQRVPCHSMLPSIAPSVHSCTFGR